MVIDKLEDSTRVARFHKSCVQPTKTEFYFNDEAWHVAPCVGSRPPARAQDWPQSKLISTEENIGRTWAGTENHDN